MGKLRLTIQHNDKKALLLVDLTELQNLDAIQLEIEKTCRNKRFGLKGSFRKKTLLCTTINGEPLKYEDLQNGLTVCVSDIGKIFDISHVSQSTRDADPMVAASNSCCIEVIGEEFSSPDVLESLKLFTKKPGVLKVLALPDLSAAVPCPVGTSISVHQRIYPTWIGNDIGCGVSLYRLKIKLKPRAIQALKSKLVASYTDAWDIKLASAFRETFMPPCEREISAHDSTMGSIGAGNHFCELQECAESGNLYLAVHSGSRSLGVSLSSDAPTVCESLEEIEHFIALQQIGIQWAKLNRLAIAKRICDVIEESSERWQKLEDDLLEPMLDVCHNFIERDTDSPGVFIHRKGAIPTNQGQVLIPGSRGTSSYLVTVNDSVSINSLPHGAGRRYTKADAEKRYAQSYQDEALASHVICHDKKLFAQESPGAYKDIDGIMDYLEARGLIVILNKFLPLLTLKYNGM